MSSRHRDRYALAVFALSLLAIVIVAALHQRPDDTVSNNRGTQLTEQQNNDDVSRIVTAIERFDVWDDTFPQWAMAGFSALATIFSVWAVFIVRDTLKETRNAVRAANESVAIAQRVGQAQVRAYLQISGGKYEAYDRMVRLHLDIENTGSSPANSVIMSVEIYSEIIKRGTTGFPIPELVMHEGVPFRIDNITASGGRVASTFIEPESGPGDDYLLLYMAIVSGSWFKIRCKLSWKDVFGEDQTETFRFVSDYPPVAETDASVGTFYRGQLVHDSSQ
ncbi:hypothetical protein [Shinella sp.]|uniref:hypothetical protein n=1 Tax=Shinella sp. TaxID=1870904 RepID=UPI0029BA234B|nr:hypothetical protein [Shinella sp.]MDX3973256.1 hypothetical protein [Shinella sp.]